MDARRATPEGRRRWSREPEYIYKKKRKERKREQGLKMARKFLCLTAQGNIDLTCNYWKGTREERGSGGMKRGGEDVWSRRQPRSATRMRLRERLPAPGAACDSHHVTVCLL